MAAFRDLPASVRAGESFRVILDAPDGALCDGSITYRDNSTQLLAQVKEEDGRCRWDVVVPEATRRGEADITATIRHKDDEATVLGYFEVGRRTDDVGLLLKKLPGSVKRNSEFSVRIQVPDKATCTGNIIYEPGISQPLDNRNEDNEQCRWDLTVPSNVERGTALLGVTVFQDGRSTTLLTSFDVARGTEAPDVLVAFQDPVQTVQRDGQFPIRVLVPDSATCRGDVSFRNAENVKLDKINSIGGVCRWTVTVPEDAKKGDSKVEVTVTHDDKDTTITAPLIVDDKSAVVDAGFKDLPRTIKRGDDLEVRVSVPDNATCSGEIRYDDGGVTTLAAQTEKKDRCLWNARVPAYTPRGTAIVYVVVDDHGVQSSLTGNVEVLGRDDEPLSATWDSTLKDVQPGQSFDVSLSVTSGSTCVGKIDFAGGMQWTLGDRAEEDSHCTWRVDVPNHVSNGKATAKVTVSKGKDTTTLTANFQVKAPPASTTTTTAKTTPDLSTTSAPPPPRIVLPTETETETPADTLATDESPTALGNGWVLTSDLAR